MKKKVFLGLFLGVLLVLILNCAASNNQVKELSLETQKEYTLMKKAGATEEELRIFYVKSKTNSPDVNQWLKGFWEKRVKELSLEEQNFYYTYFDSVTQKEFLCLKGYERGGFIKKFIERKRKILTSSREGQILYYSLKSVTNEKELENYVLLPDSAQREEWLRKFWAMRDPTPTTERNERLEEHNRRVEYSLKRYSSVLFGFPWDNRGDLYIKYGEPSSIERREDPCWKQTRQVSESCWMEIWAYWDKTPFAEFQFQEGEDGTWELIPNYERMKFVGKSEAMMEQTALAAKTARDTVIYRHDYGGKDLEFAWNVIWFSDSENKNEVIVNMGIPLNRLKTAKSDTAQFVSYSRSVTIKDVDYRIIYSISDTAKKICGSVSGRDILVEQVKWVLQPGKYIFDVEIKDLIGSRIGISELELRLPGYEYPDSQEISKVWMAASIVPTHENNGKFVRNGLIIIPMPTSVFLKSQDIFAYLEVYNFKIKNDTIRYSASFLLQKDNQEPVELKTVEKQLVTTENPWLIPVAYKIDKQLEPGDYILIVRITDLNTGREKKSIGPFKVIS